MRHGYVHKYLKELHKSALYQGQWFGKGTFFLFCVRGSNISPSSSAFLQLMEDLSVSANSTMSFSL